MALLQISEPGQTPDPHQRRIAIGIDLGTTHSLVASVRNGVSECLPDEQGRVLLPSVVRYLEGDKRQIGYEALAAQVEDPRRVGLLTGGSPCPRGARRGPSGPSGACPRSPSSSTASG